MQVQTTEGEKAAPIGRARASEVRPRRMVFGAVALMTVARSAVFVFWEAAHFDSNQAVIGLMAKHLAELRAFPVFMYGQNYQLAVEAWLAAPVFLVSGASVAALKLPLLAINVAVAFLLLRVVIREVGLSPLPAGLATLFFVLPGPGTASKLLEASGGTLEPFLYIPLLWLARNRPVWCGLILGVGFLHREFTIYGLLSLLILAAARGALFTRDNLRRLPATALTAAAVWLVIQGANLYGSAMGPGTTPADLPARADGLVEVANRICLDWRAVPGGFVDIVTVHWPLLFATDVQPLRSFVIDSNVTQGLQGAGLVLGAAMLLAAVRIGTRVVRERGWRKEYDFCAYLVLVGALSVTGYVAARCGVVAFSKMRYDMLSVLGAVGLAAWYLRGEHSKALRAAWVLLLLSWAAVGAAAHGRLWAEYLQDAPIHGKRRIASELEARGIRYGIAEYATAYPIAFLTNEHIILASSNRVRIRLYETEVAAHRHEAVRISRHPCAGGEKVMSGIHFCPP